MRLGIDLDGCVIDFHCALNAFMLDVYGLPWIEPREWYWFKAHGELGPIAYNEFMKSDHPKVLDLWVGMGTVGQSVGAVNTLAGNGHQITFVTHRSANRREVTRQWLDEHGLAEFDVVHVDPHAAADMDATHVKSDWHEADFWLDDSPEVIAGLLGAGYNAYLFDRTWNETAGLPAQRRLRGWGDVLVQAGLDQLRADQDLGVA